MRVMVYDNAPEAHGIPMDADGVHIVETAEEVRRGLGDSDALLVHTSEDEVAPLIGDVLQRWTTIPIILFSGGGVGEPERLMHELQPEGKQRLWAYFSEEAARRLKAAIEDGLDRLTRPDPLEVALEALSMLWLIQLRLEAKRPLEEHELEAAVGAFSLVDAYGEPRPVDPWEPGRPLTAITISRMLRQPDAHPGFFQRLIDIRDSLLRWAETGERSPLG